jgi:D-xylose 1-dehydrogenase (NADP+, D-xylono-1,5-lactone-forming)
MPEKKLRWGVISTANIGRKAVIPAIQASSNGEMLGVASRKPQAAAAFAADLDIPRSYGSYEALLADKDIDAVYIPLPTACTKSGWFELPRRANMCCAKNRWH